MPAKSEAQRRLLNAKFGHAWVKRHHFDNPGKLPARKKKRGNLNSAAERSYRKMHRKKGKGAK